MLIWTYKAVLLAALVLLLHGRLGGARQSAGLCALFYWLGWFTPWIIPHVTREQVGWFSLVIPVIVFALALIYFWALTRLEAHPARWAFALLGGALVISAF